jgi:hypothetical protein
MRVEGLFRFIRGLIRIFNRIKKRNLHGRMLQHGRELKKFRIIPLSELKRSELKNFLCNHIFVFPTQQSIH